MLLPTIVSEIEKLEISTISEDRKKILREVIDFVQTKKNINAIINLNFICTHNSRRSHLSQVWAQTMAYYYKIDNVYSYSGGTEATALFSSVTEVLKGSGFQITQLSYESNPVYAIKNSNVLPPVIGFSKTFDDSFNPATNFAAIMTCNSANEACPLVPGSEKRIPLTFEDPKVYDGSDEQAEKYLERSLQIATELKYVFSKIK